MEWITTIRDTFIIERNNAECIVYPLKAAMMGCFYTYEPNAVCWSISPTDCHFS